MLRNQEKVSASGIVILILVMLNVIILKTAFILDAEIYWGLVITLPLLLIAIFDAIKTKLAIRSELRQLKNPPMVGRKVNTTPLFPGYSLWKILGVKTSRSKNRGGDGFTVETRRERVKDPLE
jgi:hypothetical protein